jgi:tetratricopeptide (TPR) repeat protein
MKAYLALFAAIAALSFGARAAEAPAVVHNAAPNQPWVKDEALLEAAIASVHKGGLKAIGPHVPDLEAALVGARHSFELAAAGDDKSTYRLTDTPTEAMQALMSNAAEKSAKQILTAPNPYPGIGFFLGGYYDQIGKPEQALRVMDIALTLPGTETNSHRVDLLVERGLALTALNRREDALAAFDAALEIESVAPGLRAYIYRGQGHVLDDMGRSSEGKAAYDEALKLTANDENAKRDLDMIERLHDGGPKPPGGSPVPPKSEQPH